MLRPKMKQNNYIEDRPILILILLIISLTIGIIIGVFGTQPLYQSQLDELKQENLTLETQLHEAWGMLDSTIGRMEMEKENKTFDKP